jgi:putative membrane protein insertion efficiency factor
MKPARSRPERPRAPLRAVAVALLAGPIHVYRFALSPFLPPACRFQPTCSCYALEALAVHGPIAGSWLSLRRLVCCHPFTKLGGRSGYDPVPPSRRGSANGLRPHRPL